MSVTTVAPIPPTTLLAIQPNALIVGVEGTISGVGSQLPAYLRDAVGRALPEVLRPLPAADQAMERWELLAQPATVLTGRTHSLPGGAQLLVLDPVPLGNTRAQEPFSGLPGQGVRLLESLHAGVLITGGGGRIEWVNQRFLDLLGFVREEVIGRSAGEFLTTTDPAAVVNLERAMEAGLPFATEIGSVTKAGARQWVDVRGEPVVDDHGRVTGHLMLFQDVDAEKRSAREQLREHIVYEAVLKGTGDGIYIHDLVTGQEQWLAGLRSLYGVPEKDPLPPMGDWLKRMPSDTAASVGRIAEAYREGRITSHMLEFPFQGYDGTTRWLLDRGQVLDRDAEGHPRTVLGVVSNTNAWKQDERKAQHEADLYRKALRGTGDGVWEMDLRTMEAHWGPGLERLLGLPDGAPKPGPQDWLERVPAATAHELLERGGAYRKGSIEKHSLEYPIQGYDGRVRWVMDRGRVLERDDQGLPIRLVGVVTDVTMMRRTEQRLAESEERMTALLQSLNQALMLEDEHNIIQLANPGFCALVDRQPEELIGHRSSELLGPDSDRLVEDPETFLRTIQQRLSERRPVEGDRIPLKDGRILERDYTPVELKDRSIGHLWIHRDITDRERLEQEVQGTKELLDGVVASLNNGIVVDLDGRLHLANNALCAIFGATCSPSDLIGIDCVRATADFAHLMCDPEAFLARTHELKHGRKPASGDLLHLKDGRIIERDFVPVDLADGSKVNVFSYRDMSEHHRLLQALQLSTDQLSQVMESMGAGLLMEDPLGRLLLTNAALVEQFALTEADRSTHEGRAHGLHAELMVRMADPTGYLDDLRADAQRGMPSSPRTIHLGSGRVLEYTYHPMPFTTGKGHLWTYTDITERHLLEQEKQDAVKTRERLLSALAEATGRLVLTHDVMAELPAIFEQVGTATEVHRVYLFENTLDPAGDTTASSQRIEWNSGVAEPQVNNPDLQNVPVELFEEFIAPMRAGEPFPRAVRDVQHELFRTTLEAQGIISILILPITVRGQFWGFIGFDDCLKERQWTTNELAVLRSLSAAIAAAVERHLLTQERDLELRAERAVNSLTRRIMGLQQTHEVYAAVVQEISTSVELEHCAFHETQRTPGGYRLLHTPAPETHPPGQAPSDEVMRLIDVALKDTTPDAARPIRLTDHGINGQQLHAIMPVTTGQDLLGFISASCKVDDARSDLLPRVLERAADAIAVKIMQVNAFQLVRQHDERTQRIINNMQLGLLEVDPDHRITAVNQKFIEMSGYVSEELLGRNLSAFPGVRHAAALFEQKRELRRHGVSDAYELDVRNAHDEVRHWFISGAPSFDQHGNHTGSVNVILDITDRKRMEQDLFEANIKARSSLQAKELFLANMSHEMRTPMNVVLGLCDALIRHEQRPEQLDQLRTVHQATRNLLAITNDILELSRAASGNIKLHPKPTSLRHLIEHIEKLFQPQARSKGIGLSATIDPALQHVHVLDAQRLDQVLVNLVGNAVKFTPQGHVTIGIKAGPVNAGMQRVVITVTDTGLGMSPTYQERLFEPFSRDPMIHGAEIEGSGLGLSICKHLMDLMGGSIQVDSAPGKGTVVDVGLDLAVASETATLNTPLKAPKETPLPKATVLLVEDSAFNRKVVAAMLKEQPIELLEVEHGAAALELMGHRKVDLVLLDLRMPVMDGHEFLQVLHDILRDPVPVLTLTAGDTTPEQEGMAGPWGARMLQKPFERHALLRHMAELLTPSGTEQDGVTRSTHRQSRWDRATLTSMVGDNPSLLNDIIGVFCQEAPRTLSELEQAASADDVTTLGALAHRIRPSLRMLGITDALGPIDELIMNGRNATGHARGRGLVAVIRRAVEEALTDITN
jgi:PAS domain S-box-containing protein